MIFIQSPQGNGGGQKDDKRLAEKKNEGVATGGIASRGPPRQGYLAHVKLWGKPLSIREDIKAGRFALQKGEKGDPEARARKKREISTRTHRYLT